MGQPGPRPQQTPAPRASYFFHEPRPATRECLSPLGASKLQRRGGILGVRSSGPTTCSLSLLPPHQQLPHVCLLGGAARPEPVACRQSSVQAPPLPGQMLLPAGKPPELAVRRVTQSCSLPFPNALPTYTPPQWASFQTTADPDKPRQTGPRKVPACRAQKPAPHCNKGPGAGRDPASATNQCHEPLLGQGGLSSVRPACQPAQPATPARLLTSGTHQPRAAEALPTRHGGGGTPRRRASCAHAWPCPTGTGREQGGEWGMPGRVCGKPGPGLSRRQPHVGQQGRSPGQPSTCYPRGRYF